MLTARAAILQALRQGLGYGRLLMRRVGAATGGRASLAPGSVYPTLRALERDGLVRTWTVIAGRARGGRARTYYELTVTGIRQAESEAAALLGMALPGRSAPRLSPAAGVSSPRRRRADLARAAVRLARLLGPDECVLVGGLAVGVHGYVRATDDLDFISRPPLGEARARLRKAGIETRLVRGDGLDGGSSCLKGEIDGIPFDVLPPLVPIVWERAFALDIAGGALKVVDLDALLQLKFRPGGPHDLLDAARLVLAHPEVEARARELATAYRARDRFEAWLCDPRVRAQAREEAARGARRAKKPAQGARPARRRAPRRGRTGM